MDAKNGNSEPAEGVFRLRFEYLGPNDDVIRSEKVFPMRELMGSRNPSADVGRAASALHGKIINALREDGTIPPPSNVIKVDFMRGKRC